mgnify:CR=1 FL=1
MTNETYNGWVNYATWRINLEIFDGYEWKEEVESGNTFEDISEFVDYLAQIVDNAVSNDDKDAHTLAYDYACAFIQEVNFYEIAEHIIEEYPAIIKTHEIKNS